MPTTGRGPACPAGGRILFPWKAGKFWRFRCYYGPARPPGAQRHGKHYRMPGRTGYAGYAGTPLSAPPSPPCTVFYFSPDILSGQPHTASGEKDLAGGDFLLFGVPQQLSAQPVGQQNRADLSLECDLRRAGLGGFHGDILHLAYPDARGADGLQQQLQPQVFLFPGSLNETEVFRLRQLPLGFPKHLPLEFQVLHLAVLPAHAGKNLFTAASMAFTLTGR